MAAKKKKTVPTVTGASYCGAGIYKLQFSDKKVIQFNCNDGDYEEDFETVKKGSLIEWLDQFGTPELELDEEPEADFKVSDERNFIRTADDFKIVKGKIVPKEMGE